MRWLMRDALSFRAAGVLRAEDRRHEPLVTDVRGVLALANQARFTAGKSRLGFVNPALYSLGGAAIVDVLPSATPLAVLRNFEVASGIETRLRTINSVPTGTAGRVIEGANTSLRTTAGWDNVTGLGVPYAPAMITGLAALP